MNYRVKEVSLSRNEMFVIPKFNIFGTADYAVLISADKEHFKDLEDKNSQSKFVFQALATHSLSNLSKHVKMEFSDNSRVCEKPFKYGFSLNKS